jgi:hypothetical protein
MGCTTTPIAVSVQPHEAESCCALRPTGTAIAQTAGSLVGASVIELNGQRIAYDCAGVARAIYLAHGIDLYEGRRADSEASGVRTIYAHLSANGLIHRGPRASPGDLVFFDNTWDANSDGLINDALTHVGVVERIEPDGTVVFISRVARSIERHRMNLTEPGVHRTVGGRILNDYLRRKHPLDGRDAGRLTSDLFAAFGTRLAE